MNSLEARRQSEFADQGYLLLPKLLTSRECLKAAAGTSLNQAVRSPSWYKGGAATNPDLLRIGRNHRILSIVTQLLGPNVILWGADLIYRGPGSIHPWHSDAESAEGERFASVWIGLFGTSPETALRIVPKSHLFRRPVQRLATERHAARDELCDETVSDWAREFDPDSRIVDLELKNGDAVVFDGRIWHASRNQTGHRIRIALLLQYAAADVPVRIPVNYRDWPFRFAENRRPPCVVVAGCANANNNNIALEPEVIARSKRRPIHNTVRGVKTGHQFPDSSGFRSYGLVKGRTANVDFIEAHYSALLPGCSPHPPHKHNHEEILIIVKGTAELTVETAVDAGTFKRLEVCQGDFALYPRNCMHTIRNSGSEVVTYLMFKWQSRPALPDSGLAPSFVSGLASENRPEQAQGSKLGMKTLFERPTEYFRKLQSHRTLIAPGGGYAAHADAHDVGIILLRGTVETVGETIEAPAFIYYPAGEVHGMRNAGHRDADYLVFEFHGANRAPTSSLYQSAARGLRRPLALARYLRNKARTVARQSHG